MGWVRLEQFFQRVKGAVDDGRNEGIVEYGKKNEEADGEFACRVRQVWCVGSRVCIQRKGLWEQGGRSRLKGRGVGFIGLFFPCLCVFADALIGFGLLLPE